MPELHTIAIFLVGTASGAVLLLGFMAVISVARPWFEDFVEGQDR